MSASNPEITRPAAPRLEPAVAASLLTLYILWGSTYLAIRVAVASLPPYLMAGFRFVTAGALLFGLLRLRGMPAPTPRQWRNAALMGLFLVVGGNGFLTIGEQWVSSGVAAILIATVNLWATLLGGLLGIRPRLYEWAGIGLGLAGVVVLNLGSLELRGVGWAGLLVLAGALLWAVGSVLAPRLDLPPTTMSSAAQMLAGGAVMLVAGPLLLGERLPAAPSPTSLLALAYLVAAAIVGYTAYNFVLQKVRPALATSYAYVNPAVALLLGALVLGEKITAADLGAMVLILAGVGLVMLGRTRH